MKELLAYVLQEQICFASCQHLPCQQKNYLEFFLFNLPCIRNICKMLKVCLQIFGNCLQYPQGILFWVKITEIHDQIFSEIDFWFMVGCGFVGFFLFTRRGHSCTFFSFFPNGAVFILETVNGDWMFDLNTVMEQRSIGYDVNLLFPKCSIYSVKYLKLKTLEVVQTFLPKASLYS